MLNLQKRTLFRLCKFDLWSVNASVDLSDMLLVASCDNFLNRFACTGNFSLNLYALKQ